MRPLHEITGRLGNQLFQFAFIYAWAKEHGTDVFLQDPKYWIKYANEIKALYGDLTWTGEPMNEYVSIHVRRGDYVGNSFYVDLTETDYYQQAMEQFPNRQFLVFSDDIEWCKKSGMFQGCEFSDDTFYYPCGCECHLQKIQGSGFKKFGIKCTGCLDKHKRTELTDLNLMIHCNGHIGSNSTFAWWGAYLGKGKCVFPSKEHWYADGYERTVCPDTWIRI